MFQRSARCRSIYARFAPPWDIRIVSDANLFPPGKLSRTISLNSHYFVIFRKNPRDSLGISTLAKQMFPGRTDYLMESFWDATSRPYGYLVIDCHQRMKGSLPYLQILAKSKPKLRKILIENVPESVITAIYECCLNTLKGVIPLTQRQKRRLAPYKTHLRTLANRKVSRKRKKTYLTQRGGSILTALLPPALGVLGSLF